jgi:putative transposase
LWARAVVCGLVVDNAGSSAHQVGQTYANRLRRRRPQPGDPWHLAAVLLPIHGARHDLWRGVDQDGNGRAILGQSRRTKHAAQPCCRTLVLFQLGQRERLLRDGKLATSPC